MPGDLKRPIDGKIIIAFGTLKAEAKFAGLTVAEARKIVADNMPPSAAFPSDAAARVSTMDAKNESWKRIATEEKTSLLTVAAEGGLQMYQAASKEVPDDYVIRAVDVYIEFHDKDG